MTKNERFKLFIDHFSRNMPEATTELDHGNGYELIVSVILSAQCTDKRVNMTTPALFKRYPEVQDLARGKTEDVFKLIKSISYPNNKTKHLINMSKMLVKDFGGIIPYDTEEMQKLPGVGRKTANVIAAVLYGQPKLAVDTHVFRVANRIGLAVNAKTPLAVETQLVKQIPEEKIAVAHHWLILHGRYVCVARKPKCGECSLTHLCKYYQKNLAKSANKTLN
ncbi:MAG: endonuclease III [Bacteroidetes bacterium]|nr:endonuclease III [Bacteroidota bacterium]